jgi:tetratricopeptide (TPR) repeat protein
MIKYLCLRSKAHYSDGNIDGAKVDCDEVLRRDPGNDTAKKLSAAYDSGAAANSLLSELLDDQAIEDRRLIRDRYERGLRYAKEQKYDEAIDDFSFVITLDPEYADAYRMRAGAYWARKDKDRKDKDYESSYAGYCEALQVNKGDVLSMRWRAKMFYYENSGSIDVDIADLFKQN